ncbi:hypothetical protein [Oscillatoria sp. FACHB-1407]|nr:hypothetical protein [Oscillatoria sp. FACHB-1407]
MFIGFSSVGFSFSYLVLPGENEGSIDKAIQRNIKAFKQFSHAVA